MIKMSKYVFVRLLYSASNKFQPAKLLKFLLWSAQKKKFILHAVYIIIIDNNDGTRLYA